MNDRNKVLKATTVMTITVTLLSLVFCIISSIKYGFSFYSYFGLLIVIGGCTILCKIFIKEIKSFINMRRLKIIKNSIFTMSFIFFFIGLSLHHFNRYRYTKLCLILQLFFMIIYYFLDGYYHKKYGYNKKH